MTTADLELEQLRAQVRKARAALDEFKHLLVVYRVTQRANLDAREQWVTTGALMKAERELSAIDGTAPVRTVRAIGRVRPFLDLHTIPPRTTNEDNGAA